MAKNPAYLYKKHPLVAAILSLLTWGASDFWENRAEATPTGGEVVAGEVELPQSANGNGYYQINQHSNKAIIEWQDFSVGAAEHVHIQTPTAVASTLNRVVGHNLSNIAGKLSSTGKVILINPNGIVFHAGAKVDVAGLMASTLDMQNQDYLNTNFIFKQLPGHQYGQIINRGRITASVGGEVLLLAPYVKNTGVLIANMGSVVLASATHATVDFTGDGLINFTIHEGVHAIDEQGNLLTVGVDQSGHVTAEGGRVYMGIHVIDETLSSVINMSGVIQADSMQFAQGEVILSGGAVGTVTVTGEISAAGVESGEVGGRVEITGHVVELASMANINVSGDSGGGEAYIGGDYQGKGDIPTATVTLVDSGATIHADAITHGDGGKVIVWADDATGYYGFISARGGIFGGDGGFAEISGKRYLAYRGTIDMSAPLGFNGSVLFDPYDITISSSSSNNINNSSGTFDPTGTAILNTTDLTTALASADVIVTTGSDGNDNGDITVIDGFSWSSTNSLTLTAARNITVNDGQTITSDGGGDLTLRADNDGDGTGDVILSGDSGTRVSVSGGGNLYTYYNPASFGTPDLETDRISFTSSSSSVNINYQLINNTSKLITLQGDSGFWADSFALSNDLNMTDVSYAPIGNGTTRFTGDFDGQNFTISNLTIDDSEGSINGLGMFGTVGGVLINNLTLTNINITASSSSNATGGLVGRHNVGTANIRNITINGGGVTSLGASTGGLIGAASTNTHIYNVYVDVTVSGTTRVGGVAGILLSGSSVNSSSAHGDVTGTDISVGGFIGESNGPSHTNSYATGNVTGTGRVGGYAGMLNSGADLTNVYATGDVTCSASSCGGLVGQAFHTGNTITNSYATGNVTATGSSNVGGLVGTTPGPISGSYATGNVLASVSSNVGGLVGSISNTSAVINDSYASGNVVGATDVGGLIGEMNGNFTPTDVYATGSVTGTTNVGGLFGLVNNNNGTNFVAQGFSLGYVSGTTNVGGFVGSYTSSTADASNAYWNTETSGTSTDVGNGSPSGISGKTTAELQSSDSLTTLFGVSQDSWGRVDGTSFPYLTDIYASTPQVISGSITTTDKGDSLKFAEAGGIVGSASRYDDNSFYTTLITGKSIGDGETLLVYVDDGSINSNMLYTNNTGSHITSGLTFTADTITYAGASGATLSNSRMATALGSLSDTDILYSASSNDITVDSNIDFIASGSNAFSLAGDLTTQGMGNGTFGGTVNGANDLTIAGNADFDGVIGGSTALTSISVSGTSNIANNITTSAGQTYNGAVTLSGDATLKGTTLSLGSTLTGGNNDLTMDFSNRITIAGMGSGLGVVIVRDGPTVALQDTFSVSSYRQIEGGSLDVTDLSASGNVILALASLAGGTSGTPNQISGDTITVFATNSYTASNINYDVTAVTRLIMGGRAGGSLTGTAGGLADLTNVSQSSGSSGAYLFNGLAVSNSNTTSTPATVDPSRLDTETSTDVDLLEQQAKEKTDEMLLIDEASTLTASRQGNQAQQKQQQSATKMKVNKPDDADLT